MITFVTNSYDWVCSKACFIDHEQAEATEADDQRNHDLSRPPRELNTSPGETNGYCCCARYDKEIPSGNEFELREGEEHGKNVHPINLGQLLSRCAFRGLQLHEEYHEQRRYTTNRKVQVYHQPFSTLHS